MLELKHFQYVVTLAEELNFSKAALKLQIAQPSLSQYINKLEEELGVTLFDRTVYPMKLTVAGKIYVTGARKILENYNQTIDRITDVEDGNIGKISIGTSPSLCHYVLPKAINEFKKYYPNVSVNIYEAKTKELREMLNTGKIDFSFCAVSNSDEGFETITVHNETVLIAALKNSEHHKRLEEISVDGSVNFEQLKDFGFIALENNQVLTRYLYSLYKMTKLPPKIEVSVSEVTSAVSMVKAGLGIALLPSRFLNYSEVDNCIVFYNINNVDSSRRIAIQYKNGHYFTKATEKLIDILK